MKPSERGLTGSSPHTRGAQDDLTPDQANKRIIPAYAGSTAALASQAHSIAGSSPHTRGARRRRYVGAPADGIIPAYAGSTSILRVRQ